MDLDKRGLIGTIAFHVTVLLLFLIYGFKTPLPLPGEQGILINFGDTDFGSGPQEPRQNVQAIKKTIPPQKQETTVPTKETYMTQDSEDAPAMASSEKPKTKKEKKPTEKTEDKTVKKTKPQPKTEEKKEVKEEKPTVNTQALYQGRKSNTTYTGSEGVTTGSGNQGSPDGSENSLNRGLGGGAGITPNLFGRSPVKLPHPEFNAQKEGKVVVEIQVDRSGKVVNAVPGVKGSTTLDNYLLSVAKRAALSSRFDNKADAPYLQSGTITYIFKLK